ncbi:HxlR family transcriptional regulator [Bifidobacterium pseudolongum subsp. globosum]|uniref:HxlR family transcriptional regulator n=1 Tax=Bifidobacterium pseudolongum subsp. globosum TaxID=1690 RepID=A0A4Q5AF77_9BIFI|nr:helix-turn-helix domain-containing protein [Bifidobacterium pseudolongum]MCH4853266.1 helix-turn-helix transcriptional regulator [Bifidobacterium pseudolongum]PKU97085.1 HxlR family transcriptional regulator [Bifidobacterium pseudolongum subsp. globosum]RYP97217.1 HxlR family transcriptional regulator [Bifidobacterium pseudolongum subsp. globosum]RYQ07741.1 HxlR family transcriptional regulator [Bifidobacterium pseudolongum subsp. globosum]RYQ26354.1 HxlR family transcriptional regulator [B
MQEIDIFSKTCPTRFALSTISGKWGLLIILALANHPLRFSELVRHIGGISERMASQTLKYLERYGVVRRHVVQHATPPQVEYALTPLGRQFVKPLLQLVTLVNTNADVMVYERD